MQLLYFTAFIHVSEALLPAYDSCCGGHSQHFHTYGFKGASVLATELTELLFFHEKHDSIQHVRVVLTCEAGPTLSFVVCRGLGLAGLQRSCPT